MIWMVLIAAGWLAWGFSHYWLHRFWHAALENARLRFRGIGFIIEGEHLHHVIYDDRPPVTERDPEAKSVTFPILLAVPFVLAVVAAVGWLTGWEIAVPFGVGSVGAMLIDDQAHKRSHPRLDERAYREGSFISRVHDVHHDSFRIHRTSREGAVCNYAFCSGVVWDMVFGTWKSPPPDRRLSSSGS